MKYSTYIINIILNILIGGNMKQSDKVQNAIYPSFISALRRPKQPPSSIAKNGVASFGTFAGPIPNLNMLDVANPVKKYFPRWLNSIRIKEWEAFEISFDEGFIVGAIYDVGIMTFNVLIFYDKDKNEVAHNQYISHQPGKVVEDSLIDSTSKYNIRGFEIAFENNMQEGKCTVSAHCPPRNNRLKMIVDCDFVSISQPSVVVMPLGDNRPLYSHKELFSVEGEICIGDKTYVMNENSLAIIDDHKGYYPYNMHYDWITGMGKTAQDGVIGFNLTDNQVSNKHDYNENYLWINGDMHPLPEISIARLENGNWLATDEHDTVNVEFIIMNEFELKVGLEILGANYIAPFGYHKGWIKDIFGVKHSVNNLFGMGEDKTYNM